MKKILSLFAALVCFMSIRAEICLVPEKCYPTPGTKVLNLSEITLTVDYSTELEASGKTADEVGLLLLSDCVRIYESDNPNNLLAYVPNSIMPGLPGFQLGANTVTVQLDKTIVLDEDKEYIIKITGGSICVCSGDFTYMSSFLPETTYTVVGGSGSDSPTVLTNDLVPATISPAYLEEVTELSTFEFTFDRDIYLKESIEEPVVYKKGGIDPINGSLSVSADKRTVIYTVSSPITEPGTYSLAIPAGIIGDDEWTNSSYEFGHANDEMLAVAIVKEPLTPLSYDFVPVKVTPATGTDGLTSLSSIVLDFGSDNICYEWGVAKIYLTDANGNEILTYFNAVSESGKMYLEVKPRPAITMPGTYTLTIPQATFGTQAWLNSEYKSDSCNPELVYSWTIVPKPVVPVNITYSLSVRAGGDETLVTSVNANIINGIFKATLQELDENWTIEVEGASIADGTIIANELEDNAAINVVYNYNGKIFTVDDIATGVAGTEWAGVRIATNDGKISVTGLEVGDNVMLYTMNGVRVSQGTPQYDGVEFTAPHGTYLVSIVHAGQKIGVKVMNN